MARESLASIIKRDFGGSNPKTIEPPRQSGGIADLSGDDFVVSRALRRFETPRERVARQRAELDKVTRPRPSPPVAPKVMPAPEHDLSDLSDRELEELQDSIFRAQADREVDGYLALSPEERAAVIPDPEPAWDEYQESLEEDDWEDES